MNRTRSALMALLVAVAGAFLASPAVAQERSLDAFPVKEKVRLDGLLREWPALVELSYGARSQTKAAGLVAYDSDRLYVVMQINDDNLKRTGSYGANEDVARLLLGFPTKRGSKLHKVELFPGDPGKVAGAIKVDGVQIKEGKLIEAPKEGGYTFEASIPWSVFPEAATTRVGLTGALQYSEGQQGTISTASGDVLPPLTLEAEYSVKHALLKRERLGNTANIQVFGDLAGDGSIEKVAVYGRLLVIVGWGYRGGKEFYFQDMGVEGASGVKRLELMDLTQDGKDDIVLQKRVTIAGLEREIFQIWSIDKGKEQPFAALSHEVALFAGGKKVENRVRFENGSKRIRFSQAHADSDLEPKAFEASGGEGLHAALMPWDSVQSRAFEWTGRSFSAAGEEQGKPKVARPEQAVSASGAGAPLPANTPPPLAPPLRTS